MVIGDFNQDPIKVQNERNIENFVMAKCGAHPNIDCYIHEMLKRTPTDVSRAKKVVKLTFLDKISTVREKTRQVGNSEKKMAVQFF